MPTLLQTSHGKVTGLWGSALLRGADGKMHALKLGDEVFRGDVILTTQDGIVQLTLDPEPGTRVVQLPPEGEIDITPGAGLTGGEGGDLQPGLRVERIVETLTPAAGLVAAAERNAVAERPLAAEDPLIGNAPPVATPGSASGLEDSTLPVALRGTDRDGVVTFVTVVALPANGTLLLANGTTPVAVGQTLTPAQAETLLFRPTPDFNGPARIEFSVTDDAGATSQPAGFEIAVTPVNDAPLARADVASTAEDTPITGNLLANDSDPDGDRLAVASFSVGGNTFTPGSTATLPGIGSLQVNVDGSYTFTPAPNFNGAVPTVGYVATDGSLASSSTLTLTVSAVNDAPLAAADRATTPEDATLTISAATLLANDRDVEGQPLTLVSVQAPVNGTVTLVNGNVVFTPAPDYNGPASFTYTVADSQGARSTATVNIDVTPMADPTITIDDISVNEAAGNATFTVTLSEPSTLRVTVAYSTADGSAVAGADYSARSGTLVFEPGVTRLTIAVPILNDAVFEGTETFQVKLATPVNATIADATGIGRISDDGTGAGGTDNDTPTLSVNSVSVVEGAPAIFTVSLSNPSTSAVVFTPTLASGSAGIGTDTAAANALEVSADNGATWSTVAGNVAIAPGSTSVQLRLATIDDAIDEATETFTLTATSVGGALPAPATGSASITDNDAAPLLSIDDVRVNEAAGTATFTVRLSGASGLPVSVDFATADGSATAGADYTARAGTLTFAPGVVAQTITVAIANDAVYEGLENFNVNLSAPVNAGIADGLGIGGILDDGGGTGGTDDDRPRVASVSSPSAPEGGNLDFAVTLTNPSTTPTTVTLTPASGTATVGLDTGAALVSFDGGATFSPLNGASVDVPAGATSFIVRVPALFDEIGEPAETMTLAAATAVNPAPLVGIGTITENGTPVVAISGPVTYNEAAGTASYTVTLSNPSATAVSVAFATADGTASAGADYLAKSDTLTFAPGAPLTQTVTVAILNDAVFEGAEIFSVNLSTPVGATLGNASSLTTIVDNGGGIGGTDDDTPRLSVSGPAVIDEAADTATYTVTLSNPSTAPVTVNFATADGSATAGSDYTAASGSLTFAPGAPLTQTVTVAITNDSVFEGSETFSLNLSGAVGASIAVGTVASRIVDDGSAGPDNDTPHLSVATSNVIEGAAAVFTVSLSNPSTSPVVFTPSLLSGTAIVGTDTAPASVLEFFNGTAWQTVAGNVTIAAGATSVQLRIATIDDSLSEPDETFTLIATPVSGSTLAAASATTTIVDNDGPPRIVIDDVSVNEGAGSITFTVRLSHAAAQAVSVDYAAVSGSADVPGDVLAGSSALAGNLVFAPFETSRTITLAVVNDNVYEGVEDFRVVLSNASPNSVIADGSGTGTIADNGGGGGGGTDNDTPSVSIAVSPASMAEDAAGVLTYIVTLSNPSKSDTTVSYTLGGSADPSDYTTTATGTLVIPAGSTSASFSVDPTADAIFENAETVIATLTGASTQGTALALGGPATGTLIDDDAAPAFSINDVTVNESAGTITFTVTKTGASALISTVDFNVAPNTATTPSDYSGTLSGTLSFAPAVTTQTITLNITDDAVYELAESFNVNLSNASNATIADAQGVGTIVDNDALPAFAIDDMTVNESAGTITFTVTKSGSTDVASAVNFAVAPDTATTPADYSGTLSGTLNFAAGVSTQTITLNVANDNVFEGTEQFKVNLSGAVQATIADTQGIGTIIDNDAAPAFAINDVSVNESAGTITFTVTKIGSSALTSTVDFNVAPGTAGTPGDYSGTLSGTLSFAPAVTTQTITLNVTDDFVYELAESFNVNLANATNATIVDAQGVGTIVDNDSAPAFSIDDMTVNESAGTITFTVTKSGSTDVASAVNFAVAPDSATTPADYSGTLSGTLNFAAGVSTQTITLAVANDNVFEGTEQFKVNLSGAVQATIADAQGIGTIVDDDAAPSFSIDDVTVNESAGTITFTVTKTGASALTSTVDFNVAPGTAGTPGDYSGTLSGTLSFAPAVTTQTITLNVTDDAITELTESFNVVLGNAVNATIADALGIGSIVDNDTPPAGSDSTLTTNEDTALAIGLSTFAMNDAEDGNGVAPAAVRIDTLPGSGTLLLNGVAVTAGQVIATAAIGAGQLSFVPAANQNGAPYASFGFSVRDSSGLYDPVPNTVTLNVLAVNDAPVGNPDSATVVEGSSTAQASVLANDTDIDSGSLSVALFATHASSPGVAANGSNTVSTALGGTVTMNADGTYGYVAPVLLHDAANTPIADSFVYKASDGTAQSGWTTVTLNVTDTNPTALHNGATVVFGGTVASNLLANDVAVDGGKTLVSVQFDGTTYAVAPTGNTVVTTPDGTLTVSADGSYSYHSNLPATAVVTGTSVTQWQSQVGVYGFNNGDGRYLSGGNLNPAAFDATSQSLIQYAGGSKPGIAVGNKGIDNGEHMVIDLRETVNSVTLFVAQMNQAPSAFWTTYNANGVQVSTGDFVSPSNNGGATEFSLTISNTNAFSYLVLTYVPGVNNSQGYVVQQVSFARSEDNHGDLFNYTMRDADGDLSSSTLDIAVGSTNTVLPSGTLQDGTAGNDNLIGTAADEVQMGRAGADNLQGGDGNDRLYGGDGTDQLSGGNGADVLYGGAGNDQLTGGLGGDTFAWSLADRGLMGAPAVDTITDFNIAQGDVLDLRDLLVGATPTPTSLSHYLDINFSGGDTVIRVSSTGGFAGGVYAASAEDQEIVLKGVDLGVQLGLGAGASEAALLNEMVSKGRLLTEP